MNVTVLHLKSKKTLQGRVLEFSPSMELFCTANQKSGAIADIQ